MDFAERAEILLLAFYAVSLCEVTPARNHFVDCLGTNSLLLLLLHYVKWEFQMGALLFHSSTVLFFNRDSSQFLVRRAIQCNISFSGFVQLELSGKKCKLSMCPRDLFPIGSIGLDFQTLI